jgi:glycosyltransferase involved in cell wall biosynthesis
VDKVKVIPNGVDASRFSPAPDAHAIRRDLGIPPTAPVVSIVAALRPEKNHELFLNVAHRVLRQLPDARFLIVGDGPCRASLKSDAEARGIVGRVQFLGSRGDVPQILTATDIFALTSRNEANPISILEAMSVGRPVVATNVGSIHEVIKDGVHGLLIPANQPEIFADRLLDLLNDPLGCKRMGAAARESVIQNWSLENTVRGYEQLIESIYCRNAFQLTTCNGQRTTDSSLPAALP